MVNGWCYGLEIISTALIPVNDTAPTSLTPWKYDLGIYSQLSRGPREMWGCRLSAEMILHCKGQNNVKEGHKTHPYPIPCLIS